MSTKEYIQEHFPLLAKIDSPADLKKLDIDELPAVCAELRKFIVHELSENPGHFASSMGAVEIAVALHYVFNTPDDRLVWDVGHQAYPHKILTGRRDRFSTNRKMGGLSGFPNPSESEYDTFQAGHASNSISAALGMSIASELQANPDRRVVAVIGDASISGGLAFEGINNASIHKNNLLIVLNDNDMSIDRPVGALGEYMTKLSTSKSYNDFRYKTYQFMRKHHIIGDSGKGVVLRFNNAMKSLLTGQQNIFEGLNIRYFGPFDGHDVKKLVKTFRDIKDMTGPKLIHLHTVKGKGYEPAEKDPTTWHAPGKFDEDTGERIKGSSTGKPLKFQDVFGKSLVELANDDQNIVAITAAMPSGTSVSMMQEAYPRRTFDVGISEGHAVTFAGGLAREGLRPFVAIYSAFLQRAYDSIINDVSIARLPVTFCLDRAGLVGEDGVTHHGLFDLAFMRAIPGMIVTAPMDEHTLRNLMYTAQRRVEGPFSIRYPRGAGKMVDWHNEMQELPLGKGRKLHDGKGVAILSIGTIGTNVAEACESLHEQGIDVGHYDMIFLKPIDEEILEEVVKNYDKIITVEEGTTCGGLGGAVAEWLTERGLTAQLVRMGVPDTFVDQGTVKQLHELCHIDAASIEERVKQLLNQSEI
ncbi:MAG: 1-deoxy-D-xylulose-5-phosphate synthase [Muribaculaceae bacterium]|nr:1-deoxy-D-xylulose-5-phosphate synthase [Muribaculaceae bacterium]MBR0023341.1 1-deoxy-D-xylulose-5-phosphate synthase [Muribaculaceae bacterium]